MVSPLILGMMVLVVGFSSHVDASDPRIEFELTDEPGAWFRNKADGGD